MKTQCPHCKARFNTNEKSIGKQAKCPKCGKPFIIEPLIEQPVAVETPVAVEPPAKRPEPVAPSPKIPEPVELPVKSAAPIAPPVKVTTPIKPPVKTAEPIKEDKLKSKALSKTVFVYCWAAVRIIAGVLGGLGLMLAIKKAVYSTLITTFAAADVFLVLSVAIELALFYKMWAAIGDNQASVSPAKAVGLLFIPVFNIYWALYMLMGFAEDYNAFIQRRSVKTKDLPLTLFLIYAFMFILAATVLTTPMICVFAFVGLISRAFITYTFFSWVLFFFVLAAGIGHFISFILFAIKTCNAINALPERKSR